MSPRSPRPPATPPDPTALRRVSAGRHVSGDGRFTVEQGSNGWMTTDAERTNELGLPLVRGPYATLAEARAAVDAARRGPAPISNLEERIAAIPKAARTDSRPTARVSAKKAPPRPVPVVVREFRSRDAGPLRELWAAAGFRSIGDDDMSLRRFAQRNPGLFLVAAQGDAVVASAMGGWDGRRGWIYHLAVAAAHRRGGLATRLVRQLETGLAVAGARKVNAIVTDGNAIGAAFWSAAGYRAHEATQYGRELEPSAEETD